MKQALISLSFYGKLFLAVNLPGHWSRGVNAVLWLVGGIWMKYSDWLEYDFWKERAGSLKLTCSVIGGEVWMRSFDWLTDLKVLHWLVLEIWMLYVHWSRDVSAVRWLIWEIWMKFIDWLGKLEWTTVIVSIWTKVTCVFIGREMWMLLIDWLTDLKVLHWSVIEIWILYVHW